MDQKSSKSLTKVVAEFTGSSLNESKWEIKTSKLGGRGLFATQRIEKGDLIFSNKPLLVGPRADRAGDTFCTVCYITNDLCRPCLRCNLTVCSQQCETTEQHNRECDFVVNNWEARDCVDPKVITRTVIYLRALLLDEFELRVLSKLQKSLPTHSTEIESLESNYRIPKEQLLFMHTIETILKINTFRISEDINDKRIPKRGLYPLSAFLNHSCVPNTRNVFSRDDVMSVYASRDIEADEEIMSNYTGLLWCTPARRCQLYQTKGFWCKCSRCGDPTEMDTKLSALKCLDKECSGVLLPASPLMPNSDWVCDACTSTVPIDRVRALQSVLGSLVGSLNLDNIFQLETFIEERLALFVPFSNHIFVDVHLRLAIASGFTDGIKLTELPESRLALKESLCRGTLRTLAALGAGDARLRGLLLYHLHAALAERARRRPDLYEDLKSEIESTIEQAYIILQGDISAPPDLELRYRYLGPGSEKPHPERFFILES